MSEVDYTTMRIKKQVKAKLDALNKSGSLSDYIETMLTYFEVTNIEPGSWKVYPGVQTAKDIERVINRKSRLFVTIL